jgi:hypothetical protein
MGKNNPRLTKNQLQFQHNLVTKSFNSGR